MARLEKQDDLIRNEFLKRIQAKIAAEKDTMKGLLDETVPSFLSSVLKPAFSLAFDMYRAIDELKGNTGEVNVAVKLRLGLTDEWVLMNDVIVEPEPDVFAQTDHVLIGPPGLYIIETKAWQGAYTGFKDRWKRKEGYSWIPCGSPTKQNLRHIRLIRRWLDGTGEIKVNLPPEEWIKPLVVFTNASWLRTNNCCMPIFDGALKLVSYMRQQQARILSPKQIDRITKLLAYPRLAKAYINKEIKVLGYNKELGIWMENSDNRSAQETSPQVEEGKGKNGKGYVRITGSIDQAEVVRERYLEEGRKAGSLNKDKFKQGVFYFYLGD